MKLLLLVAALVGVVAPNAVWLSRSTARIENRADAPLQSFQVTLGSMHTTAFDLPSRSDRFLILPSSGEATVSVRFVAAGASHEACDEYVEGSMYHVVVRVDPGLEVSCDVELPLFSKLLLWEWLG